MKISVVPSYFCVVGSLESDVAHAPLKFAPSFPTEHMGQSPVGTVGSRLSTVDIG